MQSDDDTLIDPVCGMRVNAMQLALQYRQMQFAFCSEQCRERFLANPGLYVGMSGKPSLKQMGHEVIKCRRLQLEEALPAGQDEALRNTLCAMMGIKNVRFDGLRWEISYDLLQATAEQIENTITEFGVDLGGTWAEKLRRAFVHYVEETELLNLENAGGSHSHQH
jgi:YHS domain-containing protein